MSFSRSTSPTPSGNKSRSSSPAVTPPAVSLGAKNLQERLHILLSRLARTTELVKDWPESEGDDSSIHAETTTKLIASILEVTSALQKVEGVIKADAELKKALQECQVPINLLDLLDHGNGLNPDCFSRGLVREALGQLQGLKRRKKALEMLGAAVQAGLDQRDAAAVASPTNTTSLKRKVGDNDEFRNKLQPINEASMEGSATKKARIEF